MAGAAKAEKSKADMSKTSEPKTSEPKTSEPKTKTDAGDLLLALCLAALAGWIDATGYVMYRGLFVSFMSGNSTRAAVGVGNDISVAVEAFRAVAVFVAGVVVGELLGRSSLRWGRSLVLVLEALLLGLAAVALQMGQGEALVASLLGVAMGAQNASIHTIAGVSVALTYVTGTLVKIGGAIAGAIRGEETLRSVASFAAIWVALVAGGILGATMTRHAALTSLRVAAGIAAALAVGTLVATRLRFPPVREPL